ncbi:FUSC family protein, partial [Enterobacter hormaechei]
ASLSRSLYRLVGTVAGASATVVIVPIFANMPILCSVVLTGWITFCLWLSLLERTPRAYAFVLAGYTASLIGFPAVSDPGGIFN